MINRYGCGLDKLLWTDGYLEVKRPQRKRHSAGFKAEAIQAARQPGVSVATVALHYRLNANLLRLWMSTAAAPSPVLAVDLAPPPWPAFIALPLPPVTDATAQEIVIELKRGNNMMTIRLPS